MHNKPANYRYQYGGIAAWPQQLMKTIKVLVLALFWSLVGGCESLHFYQQAALGQLSLMRQGESVNSLLQDPDTPQALRERLQAVQSMLQFAEQDLQLDVGGRYQSYVGLKRDHVVWNVFVAPALVMRSEQWCYPLIGCAPYRGYFGKSDAEALAAVYAAKGFDTYVGGVSAYSTLGWFDDPLLSSFVFYSEPALANLLFHELAHSKAWVKGDVAFNESFASFVGVQGAQHWLSLNNDSASRSLARWRQSQAEWQRFKSFALDAKADFATLYNGQSGSVEQRLQQRERARAHWQQCYERHRQELGAGRFDRLMGENFNNALLMSLGTYEDWVGAFAQLFVDVEKDWQGFFTGVLALTALSAQERLQRMQVLRQRYLLQQQDTQEADHQNTKQIQCQPFSNHLLN
jgi:predicted aminopeptidase